MSDLDAEQNIRVFVDLLGSFSKQEMVLSRVVKMAKKVSIILTVFGM